MLSMFEEFLEHTKVWEGASFVKDIFANNINHDVAWNTIQGIASGGSLGWSFTKSPYGVIAGGILQGGVNLLNSGANVKENKGIVSNLSKLSNYDYFNIGSNVGEGVCLYNHNLRLEELEKILGLEKRRD